MPSNVDHSLFPWDAASSKGYGDILYATSDATVLHEVRILHAVMHAQWKDITAPGTAVAACAEEAASAAGASLPSSAAVSCCSCFAAAGALSGLVIGRMLVRRTTSPPAVSSFTRKSEYLWTHKSQAQSAFSTSPWRQRCLADRQCVIQITLQTRPAMHESGSSGTGRMAASDLSMRTRAGFAQYISR